MANYKWRNGFKPKIAAEVAGKEMDKILTSTGTLESEAIVAAAKPKRSALHPAFEWDDAKAANLHRLEHAGMLRRHLIHFVEAEGTNEPVEHRAYDFIEAEDKRTWRSTLEIMSKPDERELGCQREPGADLLRAIQRIRDLERHNADPRVE